MDLVAVVVAELETYSELTAYYLYCLWAVVLSAVFEQFVMVVLSIVADALVLGMVAVLPAMDSSNNITFNDRKFKLKLRYIRNINLLL